jgi:UDP-N-acetylglucosamine 2-epimerase (non-hydrolysing)
MNPPRKLLLLAGTRPEVIKQAPLFFAAQAGSEWDCRICFTGQHRDLGTQMLGDLGLTADHHLELMRPGQRPADFLGSAVVAVADLLRAERPSWLAVQGDTTTALAGALAGFYERVPVLHVEAGLRTHNLNLPFPEEGHRQLISRVASAHAAPTADTAAMLRAENILADRILVCGNTGIDCLLRVVRQQQAAGSRPASIPADLVREVEHRAATGFAAPLILVTMHRRESFGAPLAGMCRALARVARENPAALFVLPVHLNPEVQGAVQAGLGSLENVQLIAPQSFTAFAWLMQRATLLVTDSGGLQEEGPALGKPVLILREVTERPEAVRCGSARLIGCSEPAVHAEVTRLLTDAAAYRQMAVPRFPYGDGTSAIQILAWLGSLRPAATP